MSLISRFSLPEEWLQDIFIHWEFSKQCQLRRVCSQWNRLLRTRFVLCNMVFRQNGNHEASTESLKAAVNHAKPYVRNLFLVGLAADQVPVITDLFDEETPSPSTRLFLFDVREYDLGNFLRHTFTSISLRNVSICHEHVDDMLRGDHLRLRRLNFYRTDWLGLVVKGPSVVECDVQLLSVRRQALCRLLVANMQPLDAGQVNELGRMFSIHCNLRRAVIDLLEVFQPESQLAADAEVFSLDYSKFSPVIGRLLGCWDGTSEDYFTDVYESEMDWDNAANSEDELDDNCDYVREEDLPVIEKRDMEGGSDEEESDITEQGDMKESIRKTPEDEDDDDDSEDDGRKVEKEGKRLWRTTNRS